jgi:hypothetical protein
VRRQTRFFMPAVITSRRIRLFDRRQDFDRPSDQEQQAPEPAVHADSARLPSKMRELTAAEKVMLADVSSGGLEQPEDVKFR